MIFVLVEFASEKRDIVFLLDGSDDTRDEFPAVLQFLENMAEKLNLDQNYDQLSVAQYSRDPEVNFHLNTHTSKRDVISAIRNLQHKGGSPQNLGVALDYVRKNVFSPSAGSRRLEGALQFLVVLMDGRSQDDVRPAALDLKNEGILSFTVGTQKADVIQLQTVAHSPMFTISIPDFGNLQGISNKLLSFTQFSLKRSEVYEPVVGKKKITLIIL